MKLFAITNEYVSFFLTICLFALFVGTVFYGIGTIREKGFSGFKNFNVLSSVVLMLLGSAFLGCIYYFVSTPFNIYYLVNGLLINALFSAFLMHYFEKDGISYSLYTLAIFAFSLFVSHLVFLYVSGQNISTYFTNLYPSVLSYLKNIRVDLVVFLDFLSKGIGFLVALKGWKGL